MPLVTLIILLFFGLFDYSPLVLFPGTIDCDCCSVVKVLIDVAFALVYFTSLVKGGWLTTADPLFPPSADSIKVRLSGALTTSGLDRVRENKETGADI